MFTRRAFTLVEMLVVIAVIVVLAGLIVPVLGGFSRQGEATKATACIEGLKAALEAYVSEFDDFPPNSLRDMGVQGRNDLMNGNESLVACLSTTLKGNPFYEFPESELANLDGDPGVDFNQSVLGGEAAFEFLDPWGNPYIYFNVRSYRESSDYARHAGTYILGEDAVKTLIKPAKSEKTGRYYNPTGYQIWSCGPDGMNDGGKGDDVTSFGG